MFFFLRKIRNAEQLHRIRDIIFVTLNAASIFGPGNGFVTRDNLPKDKKKMTTQMIFTF